MQTRLEALTNFLVARNAVYDNEYSPALSPGDQEYSERVMELVDRNPASYDAQSNEDWISDLLYKRSFLNWKWATKQAETPAQAVGRDSFPSTGSYKLMSGRWG